MIMLCLYNINLRRLLLIIIFSLLTLYAHAPAKMMFSFPPEKRPYFPQHTICAAKAHYLKYKLSEYVKHPAYQKKKGITFCNVFARDIIDYREKKRKKYCFYFNDFYYDVSPVFPKKNNIYMNISRAYNKALNAEKKGLIISWTAKEAQERANIGKLIWGISAKYNHEFLVCPGIWSDTVGCWVAQAGEVNGIFRISDFEVFRKNWQDKEIKFYEFEEIKKGGK